MSWPPAVDTQRLQSTGDIAGASSDRLRDALRLLNEKGSAEDVEAYKRFVVDVAQAAAEAHKEGGFIGIGGKPISDEEKVALDEIRAVLDGPEVEPVGAQDVRSVFVLVAAGASTRKAAEALSNRYPNRPGWDPKQVRRILHQQAYLDFDVIDAETWAQAHATLERNRKRKA